MLFTTHAVIPVARRDWKSLKSFCSSFWNCTAIPQNDKRWSSWVFLHSKGSGNPPFWSHTSCEPSLKWSSLSKLSTALLNPHWILKFHWDSFRCSLFWGTVVRDHDPLKKTAGLFFPPSSYLQISASFSVSDWLFLETTFDHFCKWNILDFVRRPLIFDPP